MDRQKTLGYGSIGLAAVLLSTQGILSRMLMDLQIDSLGLAFLRTLLGTGILFAALWVFPSAGFKIRFRDLGLVLLHGVVGTGLFSFFLFTAIQTTSVMTAVTLMYTAPAFTVILARVFLREQLSPMKIGAVAMTLSGTVAVIIGYNLSQLVIVPIGLVFGLLTGMAYGAYNILSKILVSRYSSWTVNFYSVLTATVFLGILRNPVNLFASGVIPASAWPYIFLLAFLTYALAYTLLIFGFRHVQAGTGSIVANLEPVSSVILAGVILGESMGLIQGLGFTLILGSIFLVSKQERGTASQQARRKRQAVGVEEQ